MDGDVVTVTTAGTYLLSGSLTDGQVVVNSTGDGKVVLVLDGVSITSAATSPLVITAADEAVVVLADGSTNALSDSRRLIRRRRAGRRPQRDAFLDGRPDHRR